jgi:AcrR family transcriptional regulator
MDPEADRLILEATKRLLHEVGYARLTIDGVAREAGVARTTIYRRYRDKAELVSAAIDTLRQPSKQSDSGDARKDLIAQLDNGRRNFDMSLAGTLFRERMVLPRRAIVREAIERGIERGQISADVDVERLLDMLLGALFAAVLAEGKPGPKWPEETVDALWPALAKPRRSA